MWFISNQQQDNNVYMKTNEQTTKKKKQVYQVMLRTMNSVVLFQQDFYSIWTEISRKRKGQTQGFVLSCLEKTKTKKPVEPSAYMVHIKPSPWDTTLSQTLRGTNTQTVPTPTVHNSQCNKQLKGQKVVSCRKKSKCTAISKTFPLLWVTYLKTAASVLFFLTKTILSRPSHS